MTTKKIKINVDCEKLKKQYDEHAFQCKKIVKEVNKWGRKTKQNLSFLTQER